jgi:hypothetical protein
MKDSVLCDTMLWSHLKSIDVSESQQEANVKKVSNLSLRAAFGCVFNLKTLKVHNMFRSLRPSSGVKLWIEEVAVLAELYCVRQDAKI